MNAMSAWPFRCLPPVATTASGLLRDDVVHDRQVVRRQIPDDVDVVLKQSEVHPRRVEVVERPQRAAVDELPDLPDRAAEEERVVHHDLEVLPVGQLDQLLGLRGGRRERLLDEHVLAVLERRLGELEVRPDRRDHRDRVDVGRRQHRRRSRSSAGRRDTAGRRGAAPPGSCRRPRRPGSSRGCGGSGRCSVPSSRSR